MRRYQNADGSLTSAGRKRISKQYKKLAIKGDNDLKKQYNSMYVKSYNKAADKMNNGGIDKFNREQEKKYGKNFAKRDGYQDDYFKLLNETIDNYMSQILISFRLSNKYYKKADEFVKKYEMTKWDELAKDNQETINMLMSKIEKK